MPEGHNERVALFRYSVISEAVSDRLSHAERGLVVRALTTRPRAVRGAFGRRCQP